MFDTQWNSVKTFLQKAVCIISILNVCRLGPKLLIRHHPDTSTFENRKIIRCNVKIFTSIFSLKSAERLEYLASTADMLIKKGCESTTRPCVSFIQLKKVWNADKFNLLESNRLTVNSQMNQTTVLYPYHYDLAVQILAICLPPV